MKKTLKKLAKKAFSYSKKLAKSTPLTRKAAKSVKKALLRAVQDHSQREIYNLTSFYPTIQDYYEQSRDVKKNDPLISILLPTYNTPEVYLRECIESIIIQSYVNWELCIADDNSPDKNVIKIIQEYQKKDKRIKLVIRETNGHISEATNSALTIAKGKFVALMDHDDVLWPNALYEFVKVLRADKKVDFIYSDEDKIDGSGVIHSYPFLKPDFSPEFLESCNYITHFSCIRTTIMHKVGGFRKGYEGAQDWDLFIRISEITHNIVHIPKMLYSWRIHAASTASDTDAKPYVYEAQRKLLVDHIERIGKTGTVETGIIRQHRTIKYEPNSKSNLSVVVYFNAFARTEALLASMVSHSAGAKYEVIILHVHNISDAHKKQLQTAAPGATFIRLTNLQNIAEIKGRIKGTTLLYLNDDVTIKSDNWAKIALADSEIDGVAFVGPVLLNETASTVRSAGIGIGYGPLGYTDMLAGMPFDDPHYTRGLYAKSRRNVSAVSGIAFAIKTDMFFEKLKETKQFNVLDMSLSFLEDSKRHIYTPYIQLSIDDHADITGHHPALTTSREDIYLNPNFKHENGYMEVKA